MHRGQLDPGRGVEQFRGEMPDCAAACSRIENLARARPRDRDELLDILDRQRGMNHERGRHIRDHTWRLRVPRSLQEQYLVVVRTVDDLTQENRHLRQRVRALRDPGALELEARRLGMVRQGERAYVIEKLPR